MSCSPKPHQFEKQFFFFRFHKPTGDMSFGTHWAYSLEKFVEEMTKWNCSDVWLYGPVSASKAGQPEEVSCSRK